MKKSTSGNKKNRLKNFYLTPKVRAEKLPIIKVATDDY